MRKPSAASRQVPQAGVPRSRYRLDRLRLRHLRLLELIERDGSLGAAARALGTSQPAATLLLRELETVFGARLVERTARGARLTVAGRRAKERIAIALASVERALEAAAAAEPGSVLRIGCSQVAGVSVLPAALARLEADGTIGRVRIREGRAQELLRALCSGDLDCMIGWMDESLAASVPLDTLRVEPLRIGGMQVIASPAHPLARARAIAVEELLRWGWVVPPPGSRTHAAYVRLFLNAGLPAPPVAVECAALHTTLRIVSATRLLAVAPDTAVEQYRRLGLVVPLRGRALYLGIEPFAVVTRRDSDALAALRRLRDALLAAGLADSRPRHAELHRPQRA
jgi:molybdate transport repressor ModE-like protein